MSGHSGQKALRVCKATPGDGARTATGRNLAAQLAHIVTHPRTIARYAEQRVEARGGPLAPCFTSA